MNYYIFGLQRSGTNFLEQILNKNFALTKINRHNKCWKHTIEFPNDFDHTVPKFLIYKNPYTWIESLCLRNCVDWVKTQKTYPTNDGPSEYKFGKNKLNVQQLARTYKHWHTTWLTNTPTNAMVIRYEDLLCEESRLTILNAISEKVNRNKRLDWIIPQRGKVSQSSSYNSNMEQYYIDMRPDKLNRFHLDLINDIITPAIITELGYDVL